MDENDTSQILYLFDRPGEPVYFPKGEGKATFLIPPEHVDERYRADVTKRTRRSTDNTNQNEIQIMNISFPDLSIPMQLSRHDAFSLFIPAHRKMAATLIEIFMATPSYKVLMCTAACCRDKINTSMFVYALSVTILHHPNTQNLIIPPLSEVFPEKFMDGAVLSRAREEAHLVAAADQRKPIEIPRNYTASDLDPEHRLAYFREDVGINLHHWHWHLVYPFEGTMALVKKDRRGELFYYMHQQIIARYNYERLSNRMNRVKRFTDLRAPIPEGYFPKLNSSVASRIWPGRPADATLKDVNRPEEELNFDIQDLVRWRERIFEAIHSGFVLDTDLKKITLTEKNGIDILGNIIEASSLTPNLQLYGDFHNFGHLAVAFCHDPDNRYLEHRGVMGENSTAMRDPFFYAWHACIDDIFQEHKNTLAPYTTKHLDFPGVRVEGVEVITANEPKNTLSTFWQQSDVDLSRGLDFAPRGAILTRFTHLNHVPFEYSIKVRNEGTSDRKGTVRIFMGPKEDESGISLPFREKRLLMIELDKFLVNLRPGENTIKRRSDESSVTIAFERTFRKLDENGPIDPKVPFNFCGCGWPQHMLIPRGDEVGFASDLFVMVSDFTVDKVDQDIEKCCMDAISYCGIKNKKYPDARAMGYPFDRLPRAGVKTMADYLTGNMAVTEVNIRLYDTVVPGGTTSENDVGNNLPTPTVIGSS